MYICSVHDGCGDFIALLTLNVDATFVFVCDSSAFVCIPVRVDVSDCFRNYSCSVVCVIVKPDRRTCSQQVNDCQCPVDRFVSCASQPSQFAHVITQVHSEAAKKRNIIIIQHVYCLLYL